jgi:hypothetical protein
VIRCCGILISLQPVAILFNHKNHILSPKTLLVKFQLSYLAFCPIWFNGENSIFDEKMWKFILDNIQRQRTVKKGLGQNRVNKRERQKEKLIFFCFGYCSQPGFQSRRHHQAVWMFFSVLIIKLQKIFFFSIFIQSVVNCLPLHDALRLIYFLFVSCFYFNGTVCLICFYF